MARTIREIKDEITSTFISQEPIRTAYGLDSAKSFDKQFSPVSVESVMFYVVASCVWLLEKLFDRHRQEVDERIEAMRPHTLRWYVAKALAYMHEKDLIMADGIVTADYYDTTGMTDAEIEKKRIVKYAVATEDNTRVILKVAKKDAKTGQPTQLKPTELAGLKHYLSQIKDAGVSVRVLNEPADTMRLSLLVLYDPSVLKADILSEEDEDGFYNLRLTRADEESGTDVIAEAVDSVISQLPFNGEYRNSDLLAAIQAVEGVKVADIVSVEASPGGSESSYTPVKGYRRPYSGYYARAGLTVRGREYQIAE